MQRYSLASKIAYHLLSSRDTHSAMLTPRHMLSCPDSDNLVELHELVENVLDSDAFVLIQSKEALLDPRCLLELYTAATTGIPIVTLACSGDQSYDAAAAEDHLLHLLDLLPHFRRLDYFVFLLLYHLIHY